jgi:hypothetical protein
MVRPPFFFGAHQFVENIHAQFSWQSLKMECSFAVYQPPMVHQILHVPGIPKVWISDLFEPRRDRYPSRVSPNINRLHKDLSVARSNADRQSNRKLDVILRECMEFDVVVIGGAVVVAATLKC